ncbi:MAG: hypothetical protein ACYC08_10470 [Armatimonadota bacterium]
MALTLVLETDDGISEFLLTPIERKSKQTKRIPVDSECRECRPVLVTHDGRVLPNGSTALLYDDGEGNSIERGETVEMDEWGNPLRTLPSTIGRPRRLSEPVQPEELLEYVMERVYALTPVVLASDLKEVLADGCIFRVPFRPRASVRDHPAFVLANENGIFMLQGKVCNMEFITLGQSISTEDEDTDTDDEPWEYDLLGGEEW